MGDVNNYNNNFVGFKGGSTTTEPNLYQLPVPNIKIDFNNQSPLISIFDKTTNSEDPTYKINLSKFPLLHPQSDLSQNQIDKGVWLEMLIYRRRAKKTPTSSSNNAKGGFVIPNSWDAGSQLNFFKEEILGLYPNFGSLKSRGGNSCYSYIDKSNFPFQRILQPLGVNRINHWRINSKDTYNLIPYLYNRFLRTNCSYLDETNGGNTLAITCPSSRVGTFTNFSDQATGRYHPQRYEPKMTNMYIKFRYLMVNEAYLTDSTQKQFITGPTTETIAIIPMTRPFSFKFDTILNKMVNIATTGYDPYIWNCVWAQGLK